MSGDDATAPVGPGGFAELQRIDVNRAEVARKVREVFRATPEFRVDEATDSAGRACFVAAVTGAVGGDARYLWSASGRRESDAWRNLNDMIPRVTKGLE